MSVDIEQQLLSAIRRTWKDSPLIEEVCVAILDFVLSPPKKEYITLSMLRKAIGLRVSEGDAEFAAAVQYLLGDAAPVLAIGFEMVGPDGLPVRISIEEAEIARRNSINPLTGDFDEQVGEKLLTFLVPASAIAESRSQA